MSESTASSSYFLNKIFNAHDIAPIISRFKDAADSAPFDRYLNRLLAEKGLKRADVIAGSGIELHYAYKYFNGARHPSRDKAASRLEAGGESMA